MLLWLFAALLSSNPQEDAVYLVEEISFELPGVPAETARRHIYVGRNKVRTDFEEEQLRLLYDMTLGTLIVVDLKERIYYLSRPGRDKNLARSSLWKIVPLNEGRLVSHVNLVTPTGEEAIISGADCREFAVNYRSKFGVSTRIWATLESTNKKEFKNIWFAAIGTKPAGDVKEILNRLFRELKGDPVRVVSKIEQEGFVITNTSTFVSIDRNFEPTEGFFQIPDNFEIAQEGAKRPWHQQ